MEYTKQGETRPQLIARLTSRGMTIGDPGEAEAQLSKHGYHHLGGYRYVFRELLPRDKQDHGLKQYRTEEYIAGTTLDAVIALADFDARLREVVVAGTFDFEKRIKAVVSDVLGLRGPFAHLDPAQLDSHVCSTKLRSGGTKFDAWKQRYEDAVGKAASEDYITHHRCKYGHDIPVWGTLDAVSFGAVPFLLDLMHHADQNDVAQQFGVKTGEVMVKWLHAMKDLRNTSAHPSRLFNKSMKREIVLKPWQYTRGNALDHARPRGSGGNRTAPYRHFALLAYLLRSHVAGSEWHHTLATQVGKLGHVKLAGHTEPFLTPERNMGFPQGWQNLSLWAGGNHLP